MGSRKRILIIDDNREQCNEINKVLTLNGYRVMTSSTGIFAPMWCQHLDFDLVLMDMHMLELCGTVSIKRLKDTTPDMPVIIMTADAEHVRIKEALRVGCTGCLQKPLDYSQLLTLIDMNLPK
ncbi:MAG TPA: response regulator [Dehalococcoidia bacterium]|nr:response regulator [Dehalococcoidia bacterium]